MLRFERMETSFSRKERAEPHSRKPRQNYNSKRALTWVLASFQKILVIINGVPIVHAIAANLAFLVGGISAISSYRITKSPFRYFSAIMGATTLVAFVFFFTTEAGVHLELGVGGMERMTVYPTLLWIISFGGYLIADS